MDDERRASVIIEAFLDFEGDPDVVWARLSDVPRIPDYWHGTRSLELVEKVDAKFTAKVKFAFGGSGKAEIMIDAPTRTLLLRYLSGPFTGTQTTRIIGRRLETRWDIEFRGIYKIASSRTSKHFESGSLHALERLRDGVGIVQEQTQA